MVIEDLHWIDSVSEELLGKIIDSEVKLHLLVLHTRRPEHVPPWLDRSTVTKLPLEPLPTGDIRHLVQAQLGVESLQSGLPSALSVICRASASGRPPLSTLLKIQHLNEAKRIFSQFGQTPILARVETA